MEGSKTLDGSVALVTGASSGIGEATARALVAEGATLIPEIDYCLRPLTHRLGWQGAGTKMTLRYEGGGNLPLSR